MILEFIVPAVPVAQPRVKASAFRGRAKVYTPTRIKQSDGTRKDHPIVAFKATVRLAATGSYSGPPLEGPLRVDATFVFPRTTVLTWKKKPMPRLYHTSKPDRDNLDKAVMDALTGIIWRDDRQVCQGEIQKWIAAGDEQPHCLIVVTKLEDR